MVSRPVPSPIPNSRSNVALAVVALCCALTLHSDNGRPHPPQPNSRLSNLPSSLPRVTLWAWERREDLRAVDPKRFAVAYLDRTITLGPTAITQPRRNPVAFPATMQRIAVIRIEASRTSALTDETRAVALQSLLEAAQEPGIAALQIDFDATRSQRPFYRALLLDLRRQMPPGLPLSITALASWCSYDDWLRDLPINTINEAVPMFFRMEPDRRHASPDLADFKIREPLCQSSIGVSTSEPWPSIAGDTRIYVFPDHGWQHDSPESLQPKLEHAAKGYLP